MRCRSTAAFELSVNRFDASSSPPLEAIISRRGVYETGWIEGAWRLNASG
jgi:hypothetical protein